MTYSKFTNNTQVVFTNICSTCKYRDDRCCKLHKDVIEVKEIDDCTEYVTSQDISETIYMIALYYIILIDLLHDINELDMILNDTLKLSILVKPQIDALFKNEKFLNEVYIKFLDNMFADNHKFVVLYVLAQITYYVNEKHERLKVSILAYQYLVFLTRMYHAESEKRQQLKLQDTKINKKKFKKGGF